MVRLVAITAIVAGHIWTMPVVRDLVYPWHVPVFFFLSGYLWKSSRSLGSEVSRRSRTLLKPYVFWGLLIFIPYAAALVVFNRATPEALLGPVYGGKLAGGPFATFWFVFALFATAVIWRALSNAPIALRVVVMAGGVVLGVFFGPELAGTPLAIGTALPALVFLAAGQLAKQYETKRPLVECAVAAGLLVIAVILVATDVAAPVDLKQGDWGTPILSTAVAIAISWSIVTIAVEVARAFTAKTASTVSYLALTGFTIVLLHPSFVAAGAALGVQPWIAFLAALLVPIVVALVALRTPLSLWVTGVERQPSRSLSRELVSS
jgi:acyltransferase